MMILAILVGLALLFFGRQLFWLFVGGIGFAAGMGLAAEWFQGQSEWTTLLIAIVAGIIGALLSILLQRFAIGLAGFLGGGYVLLNVVHGLGRQDWAWIGFVIGGIVGALLVVVLFDWALIVLSALTGAILVTESLRLESPLSLIVFLVLFVAGIAAQSAQLRRRAIPPPETADRRVS